MTVALISVDPPQIVSVWPGERMTVNIPGDIQAYDVGAGWSHGNYQVVAVESFVPPAGKRVTAQPAMYSINDDGRVVEVYEVEDIPPAPDPIIPPIARWRGR